MPIVRRVEEKNLVVTVFSGKVTHHELMKSFNELSKMSPNSPVLYELTMSTKGMRIESSDRMSEEVFNKAASVFNKFEKAAISIVSPNDLTFGFASRFRTRIVNEKIDISVFRTEKAARKWLDAMRSLHNGIDSAFPKKYSKNPDACFELSALSYENAKRLLDFSKYLVTQKHCSTATAVATLGAEEAIKSYELLFSSLNPERQRSLSLYLGNSIKKHSPVKPVHQSVALFEIILRLVNNLIDNYKNDPLSDISKLLYEIPSLIQKRLLEEKMTMIGKDDYDK